MDHQEFAQLLGNYGEFIGAIAVVFTLGYLAVQVKHSRQSLDANTKSAEKIRLMSRGLANDPDMTDEEYMAFSMQLILILNHHHLSLKMSNNGIGWYHRIQNRFGHGHSPFHNIGKTI